MRLLQLLKNVFKKKHIAEFSSFTKLFEVHGPAFIQGYSYKK